MTIELLHTAARRYCVDRIAHWHRAYDEQQARRSKRFDDRHPDDEDRIFPRCNVLGAILSEIERWLPADAASLDDARARLTAAARTAAGPFTSSMSPIANAAMADERVAFERFATDSTAADWAAAAPLPFRRMLADADADARYRAFCARWGTWHGGYPDRDEVPSTLTLHVEVWDDLPFLATLRTILADHSVDHLFELRELGGSAEVSLAATEFTYNGSEGYWYADAGEPWMIYASHEASVTLGGAWLLAAVRAALPTLDDYVYRGWSDPPSARR